MRKVSITFFAVLFVSFSMFGLTAKAQTPDGQTPAQESVCDPLKADGVTKGLYGICVAFCEAHDTASPETPITPEDLERLKEQAPSGRILAAYNKKKQETDPNMPCINIDHTNPNPVCPCWLSDQLYAIATDEYGNPNLEAYCASTSGVCQEPPYDSTDPTSCVRGVFDGRSPETFAIADLLNPANPASCSYRENNAILTIKVGDILDSETVTVDQIEECLSQVNSICAEFGLIAK